MVLVALAEHADDAGGCWPSIDRLALFSGFGVRAVRRAIKGLQTLGLIKLTPSKGYGSHRYIVNIGAAYDTKDGDRWHDNPAPQAKPRKSNPAPQTKEPGTTDTNPAPQTENPAPQTYEPLLTLKEPLEEPPNGHAPPLALSPIEFDPIAEAVQIWNATCCPGLPAVSKITDPRKRALMARLKADFGGDLEEWRGYCTAIMASDFLAKGKKWRASFDWAINPTNITKVLEGNYANKANGPGTWDWVDNLQHTMDEEFSP